MEKIHDLVRRQESNYKNGSTKLSRYVDFNMLETINTIEAYLNSKHISGLTDSLGRDKPFFNIVTSAVNIWYRATDIDRKNIRIKATKSNHVIPAHIATIHLQNWMKKVNFGAFLNQWGRTLAQYGSAVVKFVEKDGILYPSVIPWNRLIVDAVNFKSAPVIEKLYLSPSDLRNNKSYDPAMVTALIEASQSTRKDLEGMDKDNLNDFIEVYEIHGEMPLSFLTKKEDDKDFFTQQMQVLSFVVDKNGDYEDFTLYKGKAKEMHMITHLIEEEGRTLSIGAVEHLFDAQWMQNHSVKSMKDQLDLASKLIFQTSDPSYVGRNALLAIDNGDILVHKENMPLTQINNTSHDITALQNFAAQWKSLAQDITSTPDSIRGITPPSGTAYRLEQIVQQESHSLFEIMTENKGLHIEDMMRRFVIPHIKKQMDTGEEIAATLDDEQIKTIDAIYVPNTAIKNGNNKIIDAIIAGQPAPQIDLANEQLQVKQGLAMQGNKRFFTPSELKDIKWSDFLKDFEWDCEVEVTSENTDKDATLATLNTVLQTIAKNPMILQDPNAKFVFNRIIEETGKMSPLDLQPAPNVPASPMQGQMPQGGAPVGGMGGITR